MPDSSDRLVALLKQRMVLANFGDAALQSEDLNAVLTEACRLVGEALGKGCTKVLEIEPGGQSRFVRACVCWASDLMSQIVVLMHENSSCTKSQGGQTGRPLFAAAQALYLAALRQPEEGTR